MSDLLPDGEDVRRALLWISEQRTAEPARPIAELVQAASQRFDLGPLDEELLFRTLTRPADPPARG